MNDYHEPPDPWQPPRRDQPGESRPVPPPSDAQARYALGMDTPRYAPGSRELPHPVRHGLAATKGRLSALGRIRVGLAWFWVFVLCLLIIFVQAEQVKLIPSAPILTARPATDFTIQGKIALFIEGLHKNNNSPSAQMQIDDAVMQFETLAYSSHDMVRVVVIRGEVYGSDEALYMIDELRIPGAYDQSEEDLADLVLLEKVYSHGKLTPAEADRLEDRHLWFGELATSYQNASNSPAYTKPRRSGMRLVIGMALVGVGVFVVGIAGIVFLILGVVMLAKGSITRHFNAAANEREAAPLLESLAVFLALFACTGALTVGLFERHESLSGLINLASLALIALCALLPLCFRVGWQRFRQLVGLHRGRGILKEIACGAMAYLAGTPLILLGFGVSFLLFFIANVISPPDPDLPFFDPLAGIGPIALVGMILLLVVWAPVVEEMIFRGYFYAHCRRWLHWSVSGIVVGIVFAAIHPQGIWFIPGLASVGFVLAMIREWRGSLIGSMTAHAIHNGMVAFVIVIVALA